MELCIYSVSILLVLLNFRLLGGSRIFACVNALAIQAFLSGIISLLTMEHSPILALFLIMIIVIKSFVMPYYIKRAAVESKIYREIEPYVGFSISVIIGVIMLVLCFWISNHLPMDFLSDGNHLFVSVSLFSIMTGLFIVVSRKKAVTQVMGYLIMENGIFAFGTAIHLQDHFLIESGILLDVFAAVFIMGIMVCNINREFDHIDINRLSKLKD